MKLIHKGLILISVPLAFQIFFVAGFDSLLKRSVAQLQVEDRARHIVDAVQQLQIKLTESTIMAAMKKSSPKAMERYDDVWRDTLRTYKRLQGYLPDPVQQEVLYAELRKNRQIQGLLKTDLPKNDMGGPGEFLRKRMGTMVVGWFVRREELKASRPEMNLIKDQVSQVNDSPRLHAEIKAQFQNVLLFGLMADLLLVAGLAIFFGRSIERRLQSLMDTSFRLIKGNDMPPPLSGNDELAQLDILLHNTASKLIEIQRFKKQLLGVVCHELKAPLSAINVLLSLVTSQMDELSDAAKRTILNAESGCSRLQIMVAELLDLDVMTSTGVKLNRTTVSTLQQMQAAVDMVQNMADPQSIQLTVMGEDCPVVLDADRMNQVLVNLLSNAIKFSPPNGSVTISAQSKEDRVVFAISDEGEGIPESMHETVFEVFKQATQQKGRKIKGTGLGLAISKSITEAHGGTIRIKSAEGKGCTFEVAIPLQTRDLIPVPPEASLVVASRRPRMGVGGGFRIRHKGLLLIGLPLTAQLLTVGALAFLLHQAGNQMQEAAEAREVTLAAEKLVEASMDAAILALMGKGQPETPELYKSAEENLQNRIKLLKEQCTRQPASIDVATRLTETAMDLSNIQSKLVSYNSDAPHLSQLRELGEDIPDRYLTDWTRMSQGIDDLTKRNDPATERGTTGLTAVGSTLDAVLLAGLLANVLAAAGLTAFLTQNITKRLTNVKLNAEKLLAKEPLLAPIKGSDEIANLDSAFHDAAVAIEREQQLRKQLVAVASHELRSPLSAIATGLSAVSLGAMGPIPDSVERRLKQAESATAKLIELINDILDIEKMEAGHFVLALEDVPIRTITTRAVAVIEPLAVEQGVTVENRVGTYTVNADPERLIQVLVNLLSNAIKFSKSEQSVRISTEVGDGNMLVVSVQDSGTGIPPELQEKIFERFIKADDDVHNPTGSGLGLSISKAIVEQHGGRIGLDSVAGKGTRFWFTLPLRQA